MDKLRSEMRKVFLAHFKEWYESVYGEFDCSDPVHNEQWSKHYTNFWYEWGLNETIHGICQKVKETADGRDDTEPVSGD